MPNAVCSARRISRGPSDASRSSAERADGSGNLRVNGEFGNLTVNADGTYTQLSRLELSLDGASAYAVDYPLPDTAGGTFRALAWFPGDKDHPAAPSPEVFFVVDPSP